MGVETKTTSTPGLGAVSQNGEGGGELHCSQTSTHLSVVGSSWTWHVARLTYYLDWCPLSCSLHFQTLGDEKWKEKGNFQLSCCLFWECEWREMVQILSLSAIVTPCLWHWPSGGHYWFFSCSHQVPGRLLMSLTISRGMTSTFTFLSPSPRCPCTCSVGHLLGPPVLQGWRVPIFTRLSPCCSVLHSSTPPQICGTLYLSRPGVTLCHPSLIFTTALLPLGIFVFFSISFQNLSSVRIESVFGLGQWYIPIIKGRDSAFFFSFEDPDNTYLRLHRPNSLCHNFSAFFS